MYSGTFHVKHDPANRGQALIVTAEHTARLLSDVWILEVYILVVWIQGPGGAPGED